MSNCFFHCDACAGRLTRGYCQVHLQACYERARWDHVNRKPKSEYTAIKGGTV